MEPPNKSYFVLQTSETKHPMKTYFLKCKLGRKQSRPNDLVPVKPNESFTTVRKVRPASSLISSY